MNKSRELIKKVKYDGVKSRGFVLYCWRGEHDYTIDKIIDVVNQIKSDFPNVENKHIAIESFSDNELVLYFYYMDIPKDMQFDEVLKPAISDD